MKKKNNSENKLYWRKLDNSAKIFPISNGKKYSTVFRLSVVLKEKVEPKILQEALEKTLEKTYTKERTSVEEKAFTEDEFQLSGKSW